jgi:trk system potassium uptake protein TrkH
MNVWLDLHILGWFLALLGAFQLPSVLVALVLGEPVAPYVGCAVATGACGVGLMWRTRTQDLRIRPRDGFLVVGSAWVLASVFGALPYVATFTLGPVDALFEATSGFTTTGSSVMTDVSGAQRALLLWRAITQWLGGMGIILFTIAILPLLGIGGMQLFKAEVPGPVADKVRPRVAETARRLWLVYVGLTVAEVAALAAAGMHPFDAVCHAMTTLATGGFSTRDLSIGEYNSAAIDWIVTVFMLIAGMNFVLHYRLLTGRVRSVWRDAELRYFLWVAGGAVAVIAWVLLRAGYTVEEAVRLGAFNTISILTTTGYVTADFERWPHLAQLVFLLLMVLGGMSGSTAGGVKSLRVLLGLRALRVSFDRLVHPRAVRPVKHEGRPVSEEVLAGIWSFFLAYLLISAAAAALIAADGYDLVTAFSASLTAIGNVGPGLGDVGAYDNFAHFPGFLKIVLSFCMLAGRLEVFTLLVLFLPSFWRR